MVGRDTLKKKILFIMLSIFAIMLTACKSNEIKPEIPAKELPTSTEPCEISPKRADHISKAKDGNTEATLEVNLPEITIDGKPAENINGYYTNLHEKIQQDWAKFAARAGEEYKKTIGKGSFSAHNANYDYDVLKNSGGYISIRRVATEFTGNPIFSDAIATENWARNGQDYSIIGLADIFTCDLESARKQLLDLAIAEANDRVAEEPNLYSENYEELMRQTWVDSDFYLTENGVGMVFQMNTIGPAEAGIQTFEINYKDLKDIKNIK